MNFISPTNSIHPLTLPNYYFFLTLETLLLSTNTYYDYTPLIGLLKIVGTIFIYSIIWKIYSWLPGSGLRKSGRMIKIAYRNVKGSGGYKSDVTKDLLKIIEHNEWSYDHIEDRCRVQLDFPECERILEFQFQINNKNLTIVSLEVGMLEDFNMLHGLHYVSQLNERLTDSRVEVTSGHDGMHIQLVSHHDIKNIALLKVELIEIIEQHLHNTLSIMKAWSDFVEEVKNFNE